MKKTETPEKRWSGWRAAPAKKKEPQSVLNRW
jgi:hypothetical protein